MSCFLSILVLLFFIFPSLRTCSYSLSLVNLAQSSFFMLVFSTFWTPQYVPASSYPFPLCLSKSLFPALCSTPVLFCFFSHAFHRLHLISLCLFFCCCCFLSTSILAEPNPQTPAGTEVSRLPHSVAGAPGIVLAPGIPGFTGTGWHVAPWTFIRCAPYLFLWQEAHHRRGRWLPQDCGCELNLPKVREVRRWNFCILHNLARHTHSHSKAENLSACTVARSSKYGHGRKSDGYCGNYNF